MSHDKFLKDFGHSCKQSRRSMGKTQVKAASEIEIDYRHYQNIEGGKINIRLDTFLNLARYYGINIEVTNCDDRGHKFTVDVDMAIPGNENII